MSCRTRAWDSGVRWYQIRYNLLPDQGERHCSAHQDLARVVSERDNFAPSLGEQAPKPLASASVWTAAMGAIMILTCLVLF